MNIDVNTKHEVSLIISEISKKEDKIELYKGIYWGLSLSTLLICYYIPIIYTAIPASIFIISSFSAVTTKNYIGRLTLELFASLKKDHVIYDAQVPKKIQIQLYKFISIEEQYTYCELFILLEKATNRKNRYHAYKVLKKALGENEKS
jgi:hypothetical protein